MKVSENNELKFWIEDGILYSEFKAPLIITLEKLKELIALRHEISNGEKQYWCYSLHNVKSFLKEARDYADKHGQEFLYGTAVVVNSHITMFIFNLFLRLNKPRIPFKAFTDKADAVAWLKELKQQNEK